MIVRLALLGIVGAMLCCVGLAVAAEAPLPGEVLKMTKEEAKAILGNQDLVIVDVRKATDWEGSDSNWSFPKRVFCHL